MDSKTSRVFLGRESATAEILLTVLRLRESKCGRPARATALAGQARLGQADTGLPSIPAA